MSESVLEVIKWVIGGLFGCLALWLVVRIGSAAYFRSRGEYENRSVK